MKRKLYYPLMLIWCSFATAGEMGSTDALQHTMNPIISLQGGYAGINASNHQARFVGSDSNLFIYTPSSSNGDAGFYGLFLGGERSLKTVSNYPVILQLGLEYDGFEEVTINGVNAVGVDAGSSTQYRYSYNVRTQQGLGDIKLMTTVYERYHPYGEAGLGVAFNRASGYRTTTTETGSLNFTPDFVNQSTMKLSYILGLGLDAQLMNHIRAGLGYRYSYFGTASLGAGSVINGTSQISVPFKVTSSNLYANQLIARVTYIA